MLEEKSSRRSSLPPAPVQPAVRPGHRTLPLLISRCSYAQLRDFQNVFIAEKAIEKAVSSPLMPINSPLQCTTITTSLAAYQQHYVGHSRGSSSLTHLKNLGAARSFSLPKDMACNQQIPTVAGSLPVKVVQTKLNAKKPPPERRLFRRSHKSDLTNRFQKHSDHSTESTPSRGDYFSLKIYLLSLKCLLTCTKIEFKVP